MKIDVITDLAQEPIALADTKKVLRITGSGHDTEIQMHITAARRWMESALNKSLGEKKLKVTTDEEIAANDLPYGPNQTITDEKEDGEYIYEYTTGYAVVPEDIKQGLYLLIKNWYDIDDLAGEVPAQVQKIVELNTTRPML